MLKGIDVSHWQGTIDWGKVADAGIEFAILKAGGSDKDTQTHNSSYIDNKFYENYWGCIKNNIHVGAYYFAGSNFLGSVEGEKCAEKMLKIIAGKPFSFPIFIDVEKTDAKFKKNTTEAAIAFCRKMEEWGYFAGIYASDISGFHERLAHDLIEHYAHWAARYGKEPKFCKDWQIWQSADNYVVQGISGNVDLNYSRYDFSKIIHKKGLNGYR